MNKVKCRNDTEDVLHTLPVRSSDKVDVEA